MKAKKEAPCTVAAVQDAKNEPTKAQDKNSTNELISQLWGWTDDLKCLRELQMDDIYKVFRHAICELSEEKECKQYSHAFRFQLEYYYSVFSLIFRAYMDVLDDVYTIVDELNKVHDQMEGSVKKA